MTKRVVLVLFLVIFSIVLYFLVWFYYGNGFLSFSDGAKFADVAKNLFHGRGYGSSFSFFTPSPKFVEEGLFIAKGIPPLMPFSIFFSYWAFGVSDFSVVITSGVYFVGLVLLIYLLAERLFGKTVGFLSAVAVLVNINLLDYATSGASEILLMAEILLALYLFTFKQKWPTVAGLIVLIAMYFTRTQGFIYIAGSLLFLFLINFSSKKAVSLFLLTIVMGLLVDTFLLSSFSNYNFFYRIFGIGKFALIRHSPDLGSSASLRGSGATLVGLSLVFKKVFYNLYNFYRLLPQIGSPYLWALFVIGLFNWRKEKVINSLKVASIFMVIVTFFLAAVTIPFFRYLHPVIPLVYLLAVAALVWIIRQMVDSRWATFKKWPITNRFRKNDFVVGVCSILIIFFVIGQTLGVIILDSRFKIARTNQGKPPVYVQLSWLLRDNTNSNDVIVTNLDTWGSWYGERQTVWFPLEPDQLSQYDFSFDSIYLTNYLMNDENYYMGDEWRDVFSNPESHNQEYINNNYRYVGEFDVPASETYEKIDGKAVLFVKKDK